jgi:hypothetical protein
VNAAMRCDALAIIPSLSSRPLHLGNASPEAGNLPSDPIAV